MVTEIYHAKGYPGLKKAVDHNKFHALMDRKEVGKLYIHISIYLYLLQLLSITVNLIYS